MKYRLSDCVEIISGGTPKKSIKDYWGGNVPWLTIKDFTSKYPKTVSSYITKTGLNNSSAKITKDKDILISARGTVGEIMMVHSGYTFNQSIYGLRVKENLAIPEYIYYWLLANNQMFSQNVHGSVFDTITRKTFDYIQIDLPELSKQAKIVTKLNNIDSKISVNERINDNLFELAMTEFKRRFSTSGLGKISDYFLPKRGKNLLKKDVIAGNIPVVAGGLHPAAYHNQSNTQFPVITISASGANAGYVQLWGENVWSSDSSYIDKSVTSNAFFWYLVLKSKQKQIFDAQTGSAQPHIYPKYIGNLQVPKYSDEEISKFNSFISPLFNQVFQNNRENRKLSILRDLLLNKYF